MAPRTATAPKTDTAAAPRQTQAGNLPAEKKPPHPLVAFKDYAGKRLESLQSALPPHITPSAFMSVVLTALQKKPDLLKCTQQSLWNACIDAANVGLLPDGVEGAIAPFGQNDKGVRVAEIATFMPMIGGYRKLAYEGGLISSWEVNLVRQRDTFNFALGDDAYINHRPHFGSDDPGSVIGAYSIAKLKDGGTLRDVMSLFELNKIKAKSKALRSGPWADATFEPEMHRKTMGRRHYKQLPKTPALSRLIDRDNAAFDLDENSSDQIESRQQRRLGSVGAAFDKFAGPTIDNNEDWSAAEGDAAAPASESAAAPQSDEILPPADEKKLEQKAETKRDDPSAAADEPSPADDGQASVSDHQDEQSDRRWPRGEVPSDADEYEYYFETELSDFSESAKIKPWFISNQQKELRSKCGVSDELTKSLQTKAVARISEINQSKAG